MFLYCSQNYLFWQRVGHGEEVLEEVEDLGADVLGPRDLEGQSGGGGGRERGSWK